MPRFLSPEWLEQAASAALATEPASNETAPTGGYCSVAVRQVVDGADGRVEYVVRLAGGKFGIHPGEAGPVDVEIVSSYEVAAAIHRGELSPAVAFGVGRLKLGGRIGLLVEHREDFARFAGVLDGLRATTTY